MSLSTECPKNGIFSSADGDGTEEMELRLRKSVSILCYSFQRFEAIGGRFQRVKVNRRYNQILSETSLSKQFLARES